MRNRLGSVNHLSTFSIVFLMILAPGCGSESFKSGDDFENHRPGQDEIAEDGDGTVEPDRRRRRDEDARGRTPEEGENLDAWDEESPPPAEEEEEDPGYGDEPAEDPVEEEEPAAEPEEEEPAEETPPEPVLDPAAEGDPNIVVFRISQGTGTGSWNDEAGMIEAKVGQMIRFVNDDDRNHRLHTNGAPCPHGINFAPGETYDCIARAAFDASQAGPLYDHNDGQGAEVWIKVTE